MFAGAEWRTHKETEPEANPAAPRRQRANTLSTALGGKSKSKSKSKSSKNTRVQGQSRRYPVDYKAPHCDVQYADAIAEAVAYKLVWHGNPPEIGALRTLGRVLTQYRGPHDGRPNPWHLQYVGQYPQLHVVTSSDSNSDAEGKPQAPEKNTSKAETQGKTKTKEKEKEKASGKAPHKDRAAGSSRLSRAAVARIAHHTATASTAKGMYQRARQHTEGAADARFCSTNSQRAVCVQ
ncbi:hypothetical protein DAKH74_002820 [Maudiozyma humilis]|uniref:Uncharacterized protein n=1 Tax=Maudiozyma humilis TaxID=51915 RepID=A0AAV5RSQ0_MAUHU|nr:hypothetical protein DAKH74_002820 [Kazachstania humilis]